MKKNDGENLENIKFKKTALAACIEVLGQKNAAKLFNCSEAACKSWRYGYRQPSITQAKRIILETDGKFNYESIYGSISDILKK